VIVGEGKLVEGERHDAQSRPGWTQGRSTVVHSAQLHRHARSRAEDMGAAVGATLHVTSNRPSWSTGWIDRFSIPGLRDGFIAAKCSDSKCFHSCIRCRVLWLTAGTGWLTSGVLTGAFCFPRIVARDRAQHRSSRHCGGRASDVRRPLPHPTLAMALPSSPPLLPESDLPLSSPLPSLATSSSAPPIRPLTRKRALHSYDSCSSDPVFSDDTSGNEEEDAERPRRKKLIRGPWWSLRKRGGSHAKRTMAPKDGRRNADSGVWMGSDESVDSIDSLLTSRQGLRDLAVEDVAEEDGLLAGESVWDWESLAPRIIQRCVEDGKETVDLSDIGLTALHDVTLQPLHHLIKQTFTTFTRPPSEDQFSPLTPSIQLFLSRNQLTSLPNEVFNLVNITVLSLRNNELSEIPPAIGRLTRLKELNIAGNRIQHLPWQLLDLLHCRGKHREITVRPNPLVEPCDLSGPSPLPKPSLIPVVKGEDLGRWADTREIYERLRQRAADADGRLSMRAELELRLKLGRMLRIQSLQEASRAGRELKLCKEELIYLASSAIHFFAVDGTPLRRPEAVASEREDFSAQPGRSISAPPVPERFSVPSLLELTLRRLQASVNLAQDFVPYLDDFDISPSLAAAIRNAASNRNGLGNDVCCVCGRQYIIARAQWMEYWFIGFSSQTELTPETVLPFLRKACSWACAKPSETGEFRT